MEFTLKINMDNDAFAEQPAREVASILNKVIGQLPVWAASFTRLNDVVPLYEGKIKDINGNTIGFWQID